MRRVFAVGLAALALVGIGVAQQLRGSATGRGTIAVRDATGRFNFRVEKVGQRVRGDFHFAVFARDTDNQRVHPRVAVDLREVARAEIGNHAAAFSGPAAVTTAPTSAGRPPVVRRGIATVRVLDGGTRAADHINLTVTDAQGNVLFHAEGDLTAGEIVVRG